MDIQLLFVCTGNTCRSPMAEGLAKKLLGPGVEVGSAGIGAWEGSYASEQAVAVMRERGIDLTTHRARRVTMKLLREADWIIPMTKDHEIQLRNLYPDLAGRIRRLGAWGTKGRDISDPYGGSIDVYRQSAREIETLLQEVRVELDRLPGKSE